MTYYDKNNIYLPNKRLKITNNSKQISDESK